MTSPERQETWASGASYDPYIGRWSRLVSRQFVDWLAIRPDADWLDVGCGTGSLSHTILAMTAPHSVLGIDRSEAYLAFAREQIHDPRATFQLGDAQVLPVASAGYDAVVAGLVLNFLPHPSQALGEMCRAARIGGTVAVYVWDYAGQMQMLRHFWDAAVALDDAARDVAERQSFALWQPEHLQQLLQAASLTAVEVRAIDIPTHFRDFADYWSPFLGGQGPAAGYAMSLTEERRVALREHLRATLPSAADGSIQLVARAWAARGVHTDEGGAGHDTSHQ